MAKIPPTFGVIDEWGVYTMREELGELAVDDIVLYSGGGGTKYKVNLRRKGEMVRQPYVCVCVLGMLTWRRRWRCRWRARSSSMCSRRCGCTARCMRSRVRAAPGLVRCSVWLLMSRG